jgi:hypothetical protein
MCQNDHGRYDEGKLTDRELKKIGVTRENYNKYLPKKGQQKKSKDSVVRKVMKAQEDSIKIALKAQKDTIKKSLY